MSLPMLAVNVLLSTQSDQNLDNVAALFRHQTSLNQMTA